MAATTGCTLTGDWAKLERALDPKTSLPILKKHVGKATRLNGRVAVRLFRSTIREGGFEENAPLTVEIKKSSKPLVDHGDLWKAITSAVQDWANVFVGILYQTADDQGKPLYNLALVLHEGTAIPVTDAMRGMFAALQAVSEGRMDPGQLKGRAAELFDRRPGADWHGLAPGTSHIIIPGRPFLKTAMMNPALREECKRHWEKAVNDAFAEMVHRGGK